MTLVDGVPVTVAVCALAFELRYAATQRLAVMAADMAAYSDLVDARELAVYLAGLRGWTGIPAARDVVVLMDENSWSPYESEFRLIWMYDAGLDRPLTNRPIFDRSGRHIGTPDLLDPVAGLVGEYDSDLHLPASRRRRDRLRDARYREHGLEVVTMSRAERADPARVGSRLRQARARCAFADPESRPWTIEPPAGWVPTHTVAQRRALAAHERKRLLALRRTA